MQIPATYGAAIAKVLERLQARSLLVIARRPTEVLDAYLARHPDCRVVSHGPEEALERLRGQGRYDAALVVDTLEHLDKTAAGVLLGRLRDLHARFLLVAVPLGEDWEGHASHWRQNDLVAFGLLRLAAYEQDGRRAGIYTFDLYDYKPTPDWLNPKFWAHPELFDKYWW